MTSVLVKSCRKYSHICNNCPAPAPAFRLCGSLWTSALRGQVDIPELGVSVLTTIHPFLGDASGLFVLKREREDDMMKKTLIASVFNKYFCLHLCNRSPWLQHLGSCSTAVMVRNLIPKTTVAGSELNLSLRVDLERRSVKTEIIKLAMCPYFLT